MIKFGLLLLFDKFLEGVNGLYYRDFDGVYLSGMIALYEKVEFEN